VETWVRVWKSARHISIPTSMASPGGVSGGADGSDEGEIDQGSDKTGQSPGNLSGGMDLDPSGDKAVIRKEPYFRFREGLLMLEVNGNMDLIEFSYHVPQMERKEISQSERSCRYR